MNDYNLVLGLFISSFTLSMRNEGALNQDLQELIANHVPYPRINYLIAAMTPWHTPEQVRTGTDLLVYDHTLNIFKEKNFLTSCNPQEGKFMSCSLTYRGDVVPKDVGRGICEIKTSRTI